MRETQTYGGNSDSISNLLQNGTSRPKSRRSDLLTNVVVYNHSGNGIENNFEGLKHDESLGEITGILHFSKETEEGDVSTVGKNDVSDGTEGTEKIGINSGLEANTTLVLNANCNHRDDDCGHDTEECCFFGQRLSTNPQSPGNKGNLHMHEM